MADLLQSDIEDYDEHDGVYCGDEICCPHCGKQQEQYKGGDPVPEMYKDDGIAEFKCESCDEVFYSYTTVTYSYDVFRESPERKENIMGKNDDYSPVKDTLKVQGYLLYWAISLFVVIGLFTAAAWYLKPVWLGFERKAFIASHQYIESAQDALVKMADKYDGLSTSILRETNLDAKRALQVQRRGIVAQMRLKAKNLKAADVPARVSVILNR